eukprot:931841-Pelagomonas_calceolata.AAC.2
MTSGKVQMSLLCAKERGCALTCQLMPTTTRGEGRVTKAWVPMLFVKDPSVVLNVVGLQVLAEGNPHDAQWKVGLSDESVRWSLARRMYCCRKQVNLRSHS